MLKRIEEGPSSQRRRSDKELQAALAEISQATAPLIERKTHLAELKETLYQQHIAPIDQQLIAVARELRQYEPPKQAIEAGLKANQEAREALARIRAQEKAQQEAEKQREINMYRLHQGLTISADILEKNPAEFSRDLACAFRRITTHPQFAEIATNTIRFRTEGRLVTLIANTGNSEYFLNYSPSPQTPAGQAVQQITKEAKNSGVRGQVIRNFIGFRVDTLNSHSSIDPFILVRESETRTSRLLLTMSADNRNFDPPLAAITQTVKHGDISFKTASGTARI